MSRGVLLLKKLLLGAGLLPSVPGGDVRTFDYAKAEREDAPNTGTYTVKGGRLLLRARSGGTVEGSLAGGELKVENTTFKKAGLK